MGELVSIIVPVYNTEKYLQECVESICKQSYKNLEIIIINDGSTDSSGKICDEFARKDSRIQVIHKKNEGVSVARNIGLEIAQGQYIGFIDSDDLCEPRLYEKLYTAMVDTKADIAFCGFSDFADDFKVKRDEPLKPGYYSKEEIKNKIIRPMVGTPAINPKCAPIMGSLCRCLFKSELVEMPTPLRMKEIKMAEDLLFDIEYLCRCESAVVIEDSLYNYRQFAESSSRRYITDLYKNISVQLTLMHDVLMKNQILDEIMEEYYKMTVLYNYTWCISNECKEENPKSVREILSELKKLGSKKEYREVLKWCYIKNIAFKERIYFSLIKLRFYRLILWFNRRG